MSAPTVEPLVLSCEHCSAEVQVVGDRTAVEVDMLTEDWNVEHADCGLSSELTRWQQLEDQNQANNWGLHKGDVSLIPGMPPRPSWADRSDDELRSHWCEYRSAPVHVVSSIFTAVIGDKWRAAEMGAAAMRSLQLGDGVLITVRDVDSQTMSAAFSPADARRFASVILAAADLSESEPIGGPS